MGQAISGLVFQPPQTTGVPGVQGQIWLDITSQQQQRRIPALFINQNAHVTLLFSHGNAEDLIMVRDWFLELSADLNVNVMLFDYCGYGKASAGTCTEVRQVHTHI